MEVKRWQIDSESAGARLDQFLSQQVPGLTRSAAVRALKAGGVQVPGRALKPGLVLQAGDEVEYRPLPAQEADTEPEALPLHIVYQDRDLAVIDKPAGMVTHPGAGHHQGTLVNALLYHLTGLAGIGGVQRPGIVHRLDKDTSGLIVVAKHDRAHLALSAAMQARQIRREYEAVVWGQLADERCVVETLVGRDPRERKRFAVVRADGKMAITHFQVLRRFRYFSLLGIRLETGRTHQIRIHCRYLGNPVVGDRAYGAGGESNKMEKLQIVRPARQLLHARRLRLPHPTTGALLTFESPRPEDFKKFVESLI